MTRLMGAAMIAAPVLFLASTLTHAAGNGLGEDVAGGVIQVYAMATFSLVVIGLARILETRLPRAATAIMLIGVVGVAGGVAYGINSIYAAIGSIDLNETGEGVAGPLALQIPGLLFPLTFVALGVALVRAHAEPRWCGFALVAAGVLFPLGRIPSVDALAVAADTLFLIALAPLGWAILHGRDPVATTPHEAGLQAVAAVRGAPERRY